MHPSEGTQCVTCSIRSEKYRYQPREPVAEKRDEKHDERSKDRR
jgi:hypothetical protein